MRKFKVIALSVGGKNNKIYKSGDVVDASCFEESNVDELVKLDFLEEIKQKSKEETTAKKTTPKATSSSKKTTTSKSSENKK